MHKRLKLKIFSSSALTERNAKFSEETTGAVGWLRRWWRALLAEALATGLMVLLGLATVMTTAPGVTLTHPAIAFGFVVTTNVEVFEPISGAHMNPAVTLAALLYGRIGPVLAVAYALAQLLGGLGGFALLRALAQDGLPATAGCSAPALAPGAAAGVEALLTFTLVLLACAMWAAHDDRRRDRTVSIKFGVCVAGLIYAGGYLTGASLNPARSFGPAVVNGFWDHHWVYWVGPLGGAALAALLHRFVLRAPPPPPAARAPEALPLQDKV